MLEKIKVLLEKNIFSKTNSNKKNYLISFGLGSLLTLAFAPFDLFIFCPISLSFIYLIIDKEHNLKQVFWRSFFFCFGFFVCGIYWICNSLLVDVAKYAWLIPFAITLIPALMAFYFAGICYIYKLLIKQFSISFTYKKIIFFSIFWLIFEVVRSNLFTGFPWNLLGYVWLFNINSAQASSVFGVYGMSFFACLISLTPILFFQKNNHFRNKIFGFFLIFLFFANYFFGVFYIDKNYPKNLQHLAKLRLVQANISQKDKWLDEEKYQNFQNHIELTKSKPLDGIDAVIWSETSITFAVDSNDSAVVQNLLPAIPRSGYLLSGALRFENKGDGDFKIWNSMFVFNEYSVQNYYDKRHLVPFGEYVPLHKYLSFLFIDDVVDKITGGGSGFSEGEGDKMIALKTPSQNNLSFNPLLCYEVIFSREVIDKNKIPDFFVNLTNDSWFGLSTGPYQHLQTARMRSIEYARPLVRVAQTGVSANINHFGEIIDKIGLNQKAIIDVDIYKNEFLTIYAKYSQLPTAIVIICLLLFIII
jgi:apolipoprotein N-acyltransferase